MKAATAYLAAFVMILCMACQSNRLVESGANTRSENAAKERNELSINELQMHFEKSCDSSLAAQLTALSLGVFKHVAATRQTDLFMAATPLYTNIGNAYLLANDSSTNRIRNATNFSPNKHLFDLDFKYYTNYIGEHVLNAPYPDFSYSNNHIAQNVQNQRQNESQNSSLCDTYVIDSQRDSEKLRALLNVRVDSVTKHRIAQFLSERELNAGTADLFASHLACRSSWKYPFDNDKTANNNFYIDTATAISLPFMSQQTLGTKYAELNGMQILELPLLNSDISLMIFLPNKKNQQSLCNIIPSPDEYLQACDKMLYKDVYMEIPKFTTTTKIDLSTLWQQILGNKSNTIMFQHTCLAVDERGSDIRMANASVIKTSSYNPIEVQMPAMFIANKPFIYIIKERKFNTPIAIGQFLGKNN